MKYFLDTEFIEGTQTVLSIFKTKPTIDLISIGLVCEDGREYYAISKDFNLKEAWNRYQLRTGQGDYNNINPREYWIRENVLKPIWNEFVAEEFKTDILAYNECTFSYSSMKRLIKKYGKTNKQIAEEVKHFVANRPIEANKEQWILDYDTKDVSFYGYYSDYDWVVFCWLFGKMIDLPKGFPMYCIDLQQESDRIYNIKKEEYIKGGGRNFISKISNHLDYPRQTNEHNALADARWNYELYKFLNTL